MPGGRLTSSDAGIEIPLALHNSFGEEVGQPAVARLVIEGHKDGHCQETYDKIKHSDV